MEKLSGYTIKNLYFIYNRDKVIDMFKDITEAEKKYANRIDCIINKKEYICYYDEYYDNQDSLDCVYLFKMNNNEILVEDDFGGAISIVKSICKNNNIHYIELHCKDYDGYKFINNFNYPKIIDDLLVKVNDKNKYFIGKLINYIIEYEIVSIDGLIDFEKKFVDSEQLVLQRNINSIFKQTCIFDNLSFEGLKMFKKLCDYIRTEKDKVTQKYWVIITLLFLNNDLLLIYQAYLMVINGFLDERLELL